MKDRVSVKLPSRQERLAKALAALIMGIGILLITIAFIFQPPSVQKPASPLQASSQDEPDTDNTPLIVPATSATSAEEEQASAQQAEHVHTDVAISTDSTALPIEKSAPEPETDTTSEATPELEQPTQIPPDDNQPPVQTEEEPEQNDLASTEETSSTEESGGWIYAGQFINGHWLERALVIGDELPTSGSRYTLSWGTNVRTDPPSKNTPLSKTVANLHQGQQVEVIQMKKSGNKGHIWLKIKQ